VKIELLSSGLIPEYDSYLLRNASSLFYHSSKYKDCLKALLNCGENYLVAIEKGRIVGALPLLYYETELGRVYNSLPYYGSNGGILWDTLAAFEGLVDAYNEIGRDVSTISSTMIGNPFSEKSLDGVLHNLKDWRIGQFTELKCIDKEASAKRNVKKAIREGVTVTIAPEKMDRLREMHQENIVAIGGIPKSDRFFELVPKYFKPGKDYDLYIASKDGETIGGLLLFYFNQVVEYFPPAVDSQFRSIQPLSLILQTAMDDAKRNGFIWWNWGGTWLNQTGVYRFKNKWGASERQYTYYTQLNNASLLDWPQEKVRDSFPNFYVVPFDRLRKVGSNG